MPNQRLVSLLFSIMLACSLFLIPISAQSPETPDPAQIFAEGVRFERVDEPYSYTSSQDLTAVDSANRTFRIRVSPDAEWQVFPYPTDFETIACITPRSDGTWIIEERCYPGQPQGKVAILTPETGSYQPATLVCGNLPQALIGEGEWVIFKDEADHRDRLCFTETAEIRALPTVALDNWYWSDVSQSPHGEWLALLGFSGEVLPARKYHLYSYHLETKTSLELGKILRHTNDTVTRFGEWVSGTQGSVMAYDYYLNGPSQIYYAFDITKTDSVQEALYGWQDTIYFDEIQRRYESLLDQSYITQMTGSEGTEIVPCQLMIYDKAGSQQYILGDACATIPYNDFVLRKAFRTESVYYFLAKNPNHLAFTTLYFFDINFKLLRPVGNVKAEIETIFAVSPDQRYIVLGIDNNQQLDMPIGCSYCADEQGLQVVIYDMQRNNTVYLSEPIGVYAADQVIWLDNQNLVFSAYEVFKKIVNPFEDGGYDQIPPALRRISIDENNEIEIHSRSDLAKLGEFTPDRISSDKTLWLNQRGIVDLWTFEYRPVIRDDISANYRYELNWYDATRIRVRIWREGEGSADYLVQLQPKDVSQ